MDFNNIFNILSGDINGNRTEDIAEQIGTLLFGETGRIIGKIIDDIANDKAVSLDTDKDE